MREPKVSVIVPVYNLEGYLRQCLDSLVHQTLDGLEIIVVNDGSTDDSLSVAREYERKHSNVHVISQDNQGSSVARNTGMKHAGGRYIGFLDSDDWASLDMFESLYDRAVKDRTELVIADAKVVWEDRPAVDAFFDRAVWDQLPARCKSGPFRISEEPRALLLEPAVWKRLYQRSFLDRLGFRFSPGLTFEDVPAHFQLHLAANSISLLDKPVCFYRMGRPGKITARRDRIVFQVFDVFDLAQNALRAANSDELVWALFIKIQMRFCSWLFRQVAENDRADFFHRWAAQLRRVPGPAFTRHAREFPAARERFPTLCVRRSWFLPMKLYSAARCQLRADVLARMRKFAKRLLGLAARVPLRQRLV
jgi:glycosyltransferase involved in cell wall biosynthesis